MSAKLLIMSAKLIIMSAKLLSMSATPHVMLKAPCKAQCVHCAMGAWLFEKSNPCFSLAENNKKSDNQPMKKQEKKTPLLDLEALHFILVMLIYETNC